MAANSRQSTNRILRSGGSRANLLVATPQGTPSCARRLWLARWRAFTLVELLVVIAIIGVLVALLLPAVQAARTAARRTQCMSQVKQVALAVLNYESANNELPPLMTWTDDPNSSAAPGNWDLGANWVIQVLPYLEQQAVYDTFDFSRPIPDVVNEAPRSSVISPLLCPEDDLNQVKFSSLGEAEIGQLGDNWGRGNYGANGGLYFTPGGEFQVDSWKNEYWEDPRYRGVLASGFSTKLKRITDGTTHTILIGEIRAGVVEQDLRGTWAMGGPAASGLAAHGWFGDDNGPNNLEVAGDDVAGCNAIQNTFGRGNGPRELVRMRMGCSPWGPNSQQTMRSQHFGGAHMGMLDGSVHFLSDDVELSQNGECCSVWDRLHLSADGEIIPEGVF